MAFFNTEWKNNKNAEVASWNMAGSFLESLSELREYVAKKSIEGDLLTWYRGLKAIYRWVFIRCSDEQKAEIERCFLDLDKWVLSYNKAMDSVVKNNLAVGLEKSLNNCDFAVTNALFNSGLLFPIPEENVSVEERLEREFHE